MTFSELNIGRFREAAGLVTKVRVEQRRVQGRLKVGFLQQTGKTARLSCSYRPQTREQRPHVRPHARHVWSGEDGAH